MFLIYVCKPPEYTGLLKSSSTVSSGLLCSSHYLRTGILPKIKKNKHVRKRNESRQAGKYSAYTGKKKKKKGRLGTKKKKPQTTPWDSHFIPAEKLTTGKKRPSMLKFSNIPWTGWPFIRKEMLGALRSKQQLITSSVLNRCWLGEFTDRATQPVEVTGTHLVKLMKTTLVFTAAFKKEKHHFRA